MNNNSTAEIDTFDLFLGLAALADSPENIAAVEATEAENAAIEAARVAEAARFKALREAAKCGRCNGTGYLSQYAYNGGTCYGCNGYGVIA